MGAVLQTDVDKFVAVVGGKPKPDWSGLEEPITSSVVEATRHRPTATSPSAKGQERRRKGQEPAFKIGANLKDFVENVEKHLEETGMDTIAYVQDPADPNRVSSCVADYPRFNTRVMQRMLVGRFDKYDQYDKANDKDAVEYLLNSVDKELKDRLKVSSKGRPFAQYFTKLVEIARKTNIDQVEALRTKLRAIKPSDFPGEDINALWIHTTPLVSELIACNGFDHSLTKGLVMMLLTAGGNGAEINLFKHELTRFHELHQAGLDEVSH